MAKVGRKPIIIDPVLMEERAAAVVSKTHLAQELGCSLATLERRWNDTPGLRETYERGVAKLRRHVASLLLKHAETNAIAAITLANQPHILGFTNPNQRVEGKIEHIHSMSPAQLAFLKTRETQNLPVSQNDTVSQPDTILITDADKQQAETIEK